MSRIQGSGPRPNKSKVVKPKNTAAQVLDTNRLYTTTVCVEDMGTVSVRIKHANQTKPLPKSSTQTVYIQLRFVSRRVFRPSAEYRHYTTHAEQGVPTHGQSKTIYTRIDQCSIGQFGRFLICCVLLFQISNFHY
jgi:hypothetical protein